MTLTKAGLEPLHGPRDVIRLRAHLLDQWREDGPLARAVEAQRQILRAEHHPAAEGDDPRTLPEDHWHRKTLADAALWYVDAEMCDLLAAAEKGLPSDTVLDDRLVPQPSGLVVFEKPFVGLDAQTGDATMAVDAIVWGSVHIIDRRGPAYALGIGSYQCMHLEDGLSAAELEHAANSGAINGALAAAGALDLDAKRGDALFVYGDLWAPLGRSDWIESTRVDHAHEGQSTETLLASAVEDRTRLATLWLLASQPGIAETFEDYGDRATRRREIRAGREPNPVLIISLPRRARPERERVESTGRKQRVRSWVEPFWRNQPYGPGRAYRRPTYVPGFWRGPEDGPLHVPAKVRVVRPLTDEELQAGA